MRHACTPNTGPGHLEGLVSHLTKCPECQGYLTYWIMQKAASPLCLPHFDYVTTIKHRNFLIVMMLSQTQIISISLLRRLQLRLASKLNGYWSWPYLRWWKMAGQPGQSWLPLITRE